MDVREKIFQIKYWIGHQLARSMVGNVSPAVDLVKSRLDGRQLFPGNHQIFFVATFAQREHMRMLTYHQKVFGGLLIPVPVGNFPIYNGLMAPGLIIPGLLIVSLSKIYKPDRPVNNGIHSGRLKLRKFLTKKPDHFNWIRINLIFTGNVVGNPISKVN